MIHRIYNKDLGYYYVYGKRWVQTTDEATIFYNKHELMMTVNKEKIKAYTIESNQI